MNTHLRDNLNETVPAKVTAKGDLTPATAANALARLAVGANNKVLVADSACSVGMKWGGAWTLIETASLNANAACIVFASVPSGFSHLHIVGSFRTTRAAVSDQLILRFNADNGNNYRVVVTSINHNATLATAELTAGSGFYCGAMPGANVSSSAFSAHEINIPHYAFTNKHKQIRVWGSFISGSATGNFNVTQGGGIWLNSASINEISLASDVGNLAASTMASLYGLG